jgi:hypothetical protein
MSLDMNGVGFVVFSMIASYCWRRSGHRRMSIACGAAALVGVGILLL